MNAKSKLLWETLLFHENFSFESGIQPLDVRVWSAAGRALAQWMHSWACACIGSGGIPPNDGVSHSSLERELDHSKGSESQHSLCETEALHSLCDWRWLFEPPFKKKNNPLKWC